MPCTTENPKYKEGEFTCMGCPSQVEGLSRSMPCTTESPKYREGGFGNSEHSCAVGTLGEAVK